ncbi:TIGR00266 family protein [Eubacteriales bacterium DFI.9.88]|nr:TIGR00266 family protein [Anaerovorax odorimutans]MDE8733785.1 TIGR00266 family protein [Eubacteriales bacterium DFI.9.88]
MNYQMVGKTVPAVEMQLNRGEVIFTQSGGMAWQSDGIAMSTNTRGGVLKGLGRMLAGESMFIAHYEAVCDNAVIAFASTVPGSILDVDVRGANGLIIQKGAFLCAENSVELETVFTKRFSSGFFGGEGFILQRLTGSGKAFLEIDGDVTVKELAPGEVLKVDTGNVVAFAPTVNYEVETVKGMGNILFGGEGLFLTKLTGPGKVVLQTMNFADFTGQIAARIPSGD